MEEACTVGPPMVAMVRTVVLTEAMVDRGTYLPTNQHNYLTKLINFMSLFIYEVSWSSVSSFLTIF